MQGLIQQGKQSTGKSNPVLDKIVQNAEAAVPEELQGEFLSIMTVGGKLMWSDEMTKEREAFDQALKKSGDVPTVVAHAVLKTVSIIQNESGRDKPLDAIGLATPIFMAHILQYVESRHGVQMTNQMIDETAQLVQVNLLKMYGVTEDHLQALIKSRSDAQGQPGQAGRAQPGQAGTIPGPAQGPAQEDVAR